LQRKCRKDEQNRRENVSFYDKCRFSLKGIDSEYKASRICVRYPSEPEMVFTALIDRLEVEVWTKTSCAEIALLTA
jgi:hypothetical protein